MSDPVPGYIVLDTVMFVVLIAGGVLGYYRGAVKAGILLASFYIPYILYLHFSDQISEFVSITLDLTTGSNTASLGILATFSGLLGAIGLFGGFFLASRLVLRIFNLHDPSMREKLAGAFVGVLGNHIMAIMSLMLVFMALPAATADVTSKSLWWKTSKPIARIIYPGYRALILERTEGLRAAIAEDGLFRALVEGGFSKSKDNLEVEIIDLVGGSIDVAVDFGEEFTDLVKTIDIDGLQEEINTLVDEGLTAEDVDKKIRAEEARRRQFIDKQLKGSN